MSVHSDNANYSGIFAASVPACNCRYDCSCSLQWGHFAHENSRKYDITVVTSDGLEQVIIRGAGCGLISSREFEAEVENVCKAFRQEYLEKKKKE